jgi:hypothetical protein
MEEQLIYQRMADIMKDVRAVDKTRKNEQQHFLFRGIDEVMNELHDVFAKHQVFVLPSVQKYEVESRAVVRATTGKTGVDTFIRATIAFRYITTDGSYVETVNVGEACDSGDKAMNKAQAVALKYSLMQMLLIPTKEKKDSDEFTPDETDFYAVVDGQLAACLTREELMGVWTRYPAMHADPRFKQMFTNRGNEINVH